MERQQVKKIIRGKETKDGAGVKLRRIFGYHEVPMMDPFLMLDAFDSTDPNDYVNGFPWHPHRGIETVTYMLDGTVEHGDSLGNIGEISGGDCQWMTAGSGIIHQEMPKESKRMRGIQLWVNLSSKNKMTTPKYKDIKSNEIREISDESSSVKIIAGEYCGIKGSLEGISVNPTFLDIMVQPNSIFQIKSEQKDTVFVYIIEGSGSFNNNDGEILDSGNAVLLESGSILKVQSNKDGLRFLYFSGKPINEPVAWGGPIVMNTKEELELAFRELDEGTFIK